MICSDEFITPVIRILILQFNTARPTSENHKYNISLKDYHPFNSIQTKC